MITGISVEIKTNKCPMSPSDHRAILWEVELKLPNKPKILTIPSRKTADQITNKLLENKEVTNSAIFLHELSMYRDDFRKQLTKKVGQRPRDQKLIEELLKLEEDTEVNSTINEYWHEFWTTTEELRFSNESKEAYDNLKQRLKYHLFEKRDGGIINKILKEDGQITDIPEEVEHELARTIEEIQVSPD